MTPERLNEVKKQLQTILDRHLPEEKRFSVAELDEEGLWFLIKFLLAKDKKERDQIRNKIQKTLKKKKMEVDLIGNNMLKSTETLQSTNIIKNDFSLLENLIVQDSNFDDQLALL